MESPSSSDSSPKSGDGEKPEDEQEAAKAVITFPTRLFQFFGFCFGFVGLIGVATESTALHYGWENVFWGFPYCKQQTVGILVYLAFTSFGIMCFLLPKRPTNKAIKAALIGSLIAFGLSILMILIYKENQLMDVTKLFLTRLKQGRLYWETWKDNQGRFLFPVYPWTYIVLTLGSIPPFLTAASIATAITCCDLLWTVEPEIVDESGSKSKTWALRIIGLSLIAAGRGEHAARVMLENRNAHHNFVQRSSVEFEYIDYLPFAIMGFLCLIAKPKATPKTRLLIFVMTFFVIPIAAIQLLLRTNDQRVLSSKTRMWSKISGAVGSDCYYSNNETEVCIGWIKDQRWGHEPIKINFCLPRDTMWCDGSLDLVFGDSKSIDIFDYDEDRVHDLRVNFNGTREDLTFKKYFKFYTIGQCCFQDPNQHSGVCDPIYYSHHATAILLTIDEGVCRSERFYFYDVLDFTCISFGIAASVILWYLTYDSFKMAPIFLRSIKQRQEDSV